MEDNGSELVLDPEYAATLMTELDLDAAIANHEVWRQQLEDLVHGRSGRGAAGRAHLQCRPV